MMHAWLNEVIRSGIYGTVFGSFYLYINEGAMRLVA